jgi:HK97 family phage major capsid protein
MTLTAKDLQHETLCKCGSIQPELYRDIPRFQFRMGQLGERMATLASQAKAAGRSMSEAEKADWNALWTEEQRIANQPQPLPFRLGQPDKPDGYAEWKRENSPSSTSEFMDANGNRISMLSPTEKFCDLPLPDRRMFTPLSLGKAIIGVVTGKWEHAKRERLAMGENWNAGGGFIVSEAFAKPIIDFARNQSAVVRAGAVTIPWPSPSDRMVMARVAADPTFAVVAENSSISPQALTFEQIGFDANKIACLISMSRELAEDAPNAPQIVEQTLGRALACELDRLALVGSGNAEPNGLLNYSGITPTDSVGAVEWSDVHNAAIAVQNGNFTPSGYICSPTIGGDLDLIQASTAGTWLGAPPSLAGVPRFVTKNCPDANLFIGDWSQFVFALRQDAQIEVSTSAGTAFADHQIWVKLTWRGDVGCLNAAAFHCLSGITT